ncbi:Zinc knuckle [Popillia japonica]|uniref:Zinc knuckle n=1 Tax=Popillia japonica TaxID=7064 RepID=A0AAW1LZR8_POPJA
MADKQDASRKLVTLDSFEGFCNSQKPAEQENATDRQRGAENETASAKDVAGSQFDMNAMVATLNSVLQQNQWLLMLQLLNNQSNVKSYNVMPDFSKTISVFNGEDLSKAKAWLNEIETTARLHDWPSAFMLETAKNHLTSAARHWYEARKADIGTWVTFRDEFKKTFIHERNLTTLWKQMTVRVQGASERKKRQTPQTYRKPDTQCVTNSVSQKYSPNPSRSQRPSGNNTVKTSRCFNCQEEGHLVKQCTILGRDFISLKEIKVSFDEGAKIVKNVSDANTEHEIAEIMSICYVDVPSRADDNININSNIDYESKKCF